MQKEPVEKKRGQWHSVSTSQACHNKTGQHVLTVSHYRPLGEAVCKVEGWKESTSSPVSIILDSHWNWYAVFSSRAQLFRRFLILQCVRWPLQIITSSKTSRSHNISTGFPGFKGLWQVNKTSLIQGKPWIHNVINQLP